MEESGEGDYLSQLFEKIDWASRVKQENRQTGFTKEAWESTHTCKYLWYKLEPERIDLNNPFDREEGNDLRPKLVIKKKSRNKRKGTAMDLMSEQVREVKDDDDEHEENEEEDFLDEFGNVILDEMRDINKSDRKQKECKNSKDKKMKVSLKFVEESPKEKKKLRKRFHAKHVDLPAKRRWHDMDGNKANEQNLKKAKFSSLGFEFPRMSSLSCWQQDKFLCLQMIINKGGKLSSVDEKIYLQLLTMVQEERAEYTKFSKELCEEEKDVYEKILPDLDKYVTEHREKRKTRVLQYPRYWKRVKDVRLSAARTEQGTLHKYHLQPADLILEKGVIPMASIPKKNNEIVLPKSYNRLVNKYPADPNIKPGTQGYSRGAERNLRTGMTDNKELPTLQPEIVADNEYIHNVSVMEDKNASCIAATSLPDVIISASGIKCIIDNFYPSFSREWDIPVFVQEYATDDLKSRRTVIYIGKPFLARSVNATDRNKLAYKYSARTAITKDWGTKGRGKNVIAGEHKDPNLRVEAISDLLAAHAHEDLFDANLEDFESFGESSKPPAKVKSTKTLEQELSKSGDDANMQLEDKLNEQELSNSGDDANMQSEGKLNDDMSQVDGCASALSGTLSAMSFLDLEIPTLTQSDLLNYKDAIIFDPNLKFDDNWLMQLDGAVTLSDDEDVGLTIDLGPNATSSEDNDSTAVSVESNMNENKDNNDSEQGTSQERRSMRLRLQSGSKQPPPPSPKIERNSKAERSRRRAPRNQNCLVESDESKPPAKLCKDETNEPDKQKEEKEKPSIKNENDDATNQSMQNVGILDSLLTGQSALLSKQQTSSYVKKEKRVYKGEEINYAGGHLRSADQFIPPLPGTNFSYRLWNLWNENKQNSQFRIVIRSKVACFCPYIGAIVPSVKLEYQKVLGAEQCTVSECCREWIDNVIRPDATTLRYRIEPSSGQVLNTQKLDANKIKEEGAVEHNQNGDEGAAPARFDPSLQLANLHNLISDIRGLSPGTYLLSHDRKSGPFCRLYQKAEKDNSDFDLHESYAYIDPSFTTPNTKVPWRQIDYNCITPFNMKNRRVPGLFEPYDRN